MVGESSRTSEALPAVYANSLAQLCDAYTFIQAICISYMLLLLLVTCLHGKDALSTHQVQGLFATARPQAGPTELNP
jgi:hypothetical protein